MASLPSHNEQRQILDMDEAHSIHELFTQDSTVKMCRNLLVNTMLSSGISFERGDGTVCPAAFQEELELNWIPFAKALIDSFLMFGYAPWLAVERPMAKRNHPPKKRGAKVVMVPRIPPPGTYQVETLLDENYGQRLRFLPMRRRMDGASHHDDRVQIIVSSSDPLPNMKTGGHASLLAALLPEFRVKMHLTKGTLIADAHRSKIALITQDAPGNASLTEVMKEEPFGDPEEILEDLEEHRYRKSQSDMTALQNSRDMADQLNRGARHLENPFNPRSARLDVQQSYQNALFKLPDGMQVANHPPIPPIRTDLMDRERSRISIVCACFGIPQSVLGLSTGGHQNSGGASDNDYRQFTRTLESFAETIERALTEVYHTIYPDDPTAKLTLPMMPFTTIENLILLMHEGIASRKDLGEQLLRTSGLPISMLDLSEPAPTPTKQGGVQETTTDPSEDDADANGSNKR